MFINESNPKISLEHEFSEIFLKPLNLQNQENILYSWLSLVNSLTINSVKILTDNFKNYFDSLESLSGLNNEKYNNMKIYHIDFFPNGTIQWMPGQSKKKLFDALRSEYKQHKKINIELPEQIVYKASYIDEACKL